MYVSMNTTREYMPYARPNRLLPVPVMEPPTKENPVA
jgi:hypothetical protein